MVVRFQAFCGFAEVLRFRASLLICFFWGLVFDWISAIHSNHLIPSTSEPSPILSEAGNRSPLLEKAEGMRLQKHI